MANEPSTLPLLDIIGVDQQAATPIAHAKLRYSSQSGSVEMSLTITGFTPVHSRPGRTMLRPNRTAINHHNVIFRKTRRHRMTDMVAVCAKQQYRAEHLWRLRLNHQHQVREDFAKRSVSGNHLLDALLLRAKLSVILLSRRDDIRQGRRHFLSFRSSK